MASIRTMTISDSGTFGTPLKGGCPVCPAMPPFMAGHLGRFVPVVPFVPAEGS
jgi:hypothetical protein